MTSQLESVVTAIVDNNYTTLVMLTAVGYDYILTFSDEVEYVWNTHWTQISTLFLFVRYSGLCTLIIYSLLGSSFLPGPAKMYVFTSRCPTDRPKPFDRCKILYIIGEWMILSFIATADLAMILRVWAMYIRSKIILRILLTLYFMEIVPIVIACIISVFKDKVTTVQVLGLSFCTTQPGSAIWATVDASVHFVLASTMYLLVSSKFIRDSLQMYRITNKWQPNRYMSLFARQGMLHFLAVLLFALAHILGFKINFTGWQVLPAGILEYVPVFTLTPRFILSVRAMYARDLRGRCGSHEADTEFGLTSMHATRLSGPVIVFADVPEEREDDGLELDE